MSMVRKAASQERGWRDAKTSLVASERGERGGEREEERESRGRSTEQLCECGFQTARGVGSALCRLQDPQPLPWVGL